ncbi:MAG: Glucokinase [Planctomycetes bacterium ADurb.Bin126]|nr:MAG: Glucokinase [Planctomycetes bacterium ADurb.Bin126]
MHNVGLGDLIERDYPMAKWCLGIDLGGTFIKFVLVDEKFRPTPTMQLPTPPQGGAGNVVAQMAAGLGKILKKNRVRRDDVLGIGVGSPGPISISRGMVMAMPNIPGMDKCPLAGMVAEAAGLPTVLENDANAAAYGEYIAGAGKNVGDMVMFTLGTGVGGGVIIGGQIVHGVHDAGAELGHLIVQPEGALCGCGQRGCLEQYASATFMAKRTEEALAAGDEPSLLRAVLKRKGKLESRDVNEARAKGDKFAARMWDQCAYYLALACVSFCRIFDPDEIVLAGGMSNAGQDLLRPLKKHFKAQTWTLLPPLTRISIARLGNDAGAIGAAGVAWQRLGGK